jgi:hypothetical protein
MDSYPNVYIIKGSNTYQNIKWRANIKEML